MKKKVENYGRRSGAQVSKQQKAADLYFKMVTPGRAFRGAMADRRAAEYLLAKVERALGESGKPKRKP